MRTTTQNLGHGRLSVKEALRLLDRWSHEIVRPTQRDRRGLQRLRLLLLGDRAGKNFAGIIALRLARRAWASKVPVTVESRRAELRSAITIIETIRGE